MGRAGGRRNRPERAVCETGHLCRAARSGRGHLRVAAGSPRWKRNAETWPNAEAALSLRNVGWHSAIAAPFAQWFDVALPDGSSARIWVYDWSVCDAGDVAGWFVIARMTNPAGSENLLPAQFDDPSQFR